MDTIFIKILIVLYIQRSSKTSDSYSLLLNLLDKTNLRSDKSVILSNLGIYYAWINKEKVMQKQFI